MKTFAAFAVLALSLAFTPAARATHPDAVVLDRFGRPVIVEHSRVFFVPDNTVFLNRRPVVFVEQRRNPGVTVIRRGVFGRTVILNRR
jgi:hypothetical protein